jgi:DNA repair protein RadA
MAKEKEIVKEEQPELTLTNLPGVGPATVEKLESAGLGTVLSVAVAHPSTLIDVAGMSEATARKVIKAARDMMGIGFTDGLNLEETQSKKGFMISLGVKTFDDILAGGIKSGGITEVYGEWGSGKTQITHQLCVNVLKQFPDGVVVYIDTEGTFTPLRIRQMAKAKGLNEDETLKKIMVAKAFNSDHQVFLAESVEGLFKQNKNVVLVIVDSLTAHFRAEFTGRGTLADRQQKINKHMRTLSKLADIRDIPVFVTNQVSASPAVFYGNPNQAIGGNIVGHNSRERIFVRKGAKGTRVAKLVDSPFLADAEASYVVTENGLEDIE